MSYWILNDRIDFFRVYDGTLPDPSEEKQHQHTIYYLESYSKDSANRIQKQGGKIALSAAAFFSYSKDPISLNYLFVIVDQKNENLEPFLNFNIPEHCTIQVRFSETFHVKDVIEMATKGYIVDITPHVMAEQLSEDVIAVLEAFLFQEDLTTPVLPFAAFLEDFVRGGQTDLSRAFLAPKNQVYIDQVLQEKMKIQGELMDHLKLLDHNCLECSVFPYCLGWLKYGAFNCNSMKSQILMPLFHTAQEIRTMTKQKRYIGERL